MEGHNAGLAARRPRKSTALVLDKTGCHKSPQSSVVTLLCYLSAIDTYSCIGHTIPMSAYTREPQGFKEQSTVKKKMKTPSTKSIVMSPTIPRSDPPKVQIQTRR